MAREQIYQALIKRYEAEVADADAKIVQLMTQPRIIPEHIDITGEIDKLLGKIEMAESKMSILKQKYGIN
jgi:Zn-dependent oligopeptidase|tara:strand:- start:803 stop:1012 length:210 start_codon:yes stop_codon:yes gene_type:complete